MKQLILSDSRYFNLGYDPNQATYLGEWCLTTDTEYNVSIDRILKSPYESMDDVLNAANYVQGYTVRIIDQLIPILNSHFNLTLSEKFWKVYLSPSLINILGLFYDRYLNIIKLKKVKEKLKVKVLDCSNDFKIIEKDIFYQKFLKLEGNLLLFSIILKELKLSNLDLELIDLNRNEGLAELTGITFNRDQVISIESNFLQSLQRKIFLNPSVYIGTVYGLTKLEKIYFLFRILGKGKYLINILKNIFTETSWIQKFDFLGSELRNLEASNEFEKIVNKYIHCFLPIPSLETIKAFRRFTPKIWIGTDIYNNSDIELALTKESGGKWINLQHGGGYGALQSLPQTFHEYTLADNFLTWGWEYHHIQKYSKQKNIPKSPMLSKVKNIGVSLFKSKIILISTDHYKCFYKLQSALRTDQHTLYQKMKLNFFDTLDTRIKKSFVYRPYPIKYSNQVEPLLRASVQVDRKTYKNQTDLYKNYKLVVVDHLATSHLISIAMDIPTIIYFDPNMFGLCKEVIPYYEDLKKQGIVFHSPKEAAEKVNEVFDNVEQWWNDTKRQEALNKFRKVQCDSEFDWKKNWIKYLKDEVSKII